MATPLPEAQPSIPIVYIPGFFAGLTPGALQSARLILGLLFQMYRPLSVVDVS
jgi:hypothetical protein